MFLVPVYLKTRSRQVSCRQGIPEPKHSHQRDQETSGRGVMRSSVGFDLCDREGDAARHD